MRKIVGILIGVFALSVLPSIAANTPKSGASCTKAGITATYQNKKFTCIKSGSKLIWNTGVILKQAAPAKSPTPKPSISASPSSKPQISPDAQPTTSVSPTPSPSTSASPSVASSPSPSTTPTQSSPKRYQDVPCDKPGTSLKDGGDLYKCNLMQASKLFWRWSSGPLDKATDTYVGTNCSKSLELMVVKDSTYRCTAEGTVEGRWNYLDTNLFDSRMNDACTKTGEIIKVQNGYLQCETVYADVLVLKFHQDRALPTKNATKYLGKAAEGGSCDVSGDTFDVSNGYLECRYTHGNKLQWFKINSVFAWTSNPASPLGVETCRLKNADIPYASWRLPGIEAGFPLVARNGMNNPGENNVLMVGIDFPEYPGDQTLKQTLATDKQIFTEWFNYFSNGKVKMNVTTIDHWVRSARAAKDYRDYEVDRLAFSQNAINDNVKYSGQPLIDEISKELDLRKFSTVYIFFPPGEMDFKANLILRNASFKIKEGGTTNLNLFVWNSDNEALRRTHWYFDIHESLHDFPLSLHAPGNGWIEEEATFALNSWQRFTMNWLNDDQVYCVEKASLKTTDIRLSPVEREDLLTKMATVKISPTKAIVIQAHGLDKWSKVDLARASFAPGFYGIVAYLVNLEDSGAVNFGTDGRATTNDNGNDPTYPKWAYYMPIDGDTTYTSDFFDFAPWRNLNRYVAGIGDSFKIEGVKIEFVATGDYETVRISIDR